MPIPVHVLWMQAVALFLVGIEPRAAAHPAGAAEHMLDAIGTDSGYDIDGVGVEQASNRDFFSVAAQQLPSEVERSNGSGYFAAVYIAIDVESGFLLSGPVAVWVIVSAQMSRPS